MTAIIAWERRTRSRDKLASLEHGLDSKIKATMISTEWIQVVQVGVCGTGSFNARGEGQ